MKKGQVWILLSILLVLSIIGLSIKAYTSEPERSNEQVLLEPLSLEEQAEKLRLTVEAAQRAAFQLDDPELEKWIFRKLSEAIYFDVKWKEKEIIKQARVDMQENVDFIQYAAAEYEIVVSDDMYVEYIDKHFNSEAMRESVEFYAGAMNISADDYIYDFERDRVIRLITMELLYPVLYDKYNTLDELNNKERVYYNWETIFEKYAEEIKMFKK